MQHESLFSCQKMLVTCRYGAIWWWVKCSDILGDMIQLRYIMYLLLDLAWISIFLKQHCGRGKNRATAEPFTFLTFHWKIYTPYELLSSSIGKTHTHTHSYLTNLQLPHRCCQSSRHINTEPRAQPATCRQSARHLRKREEHISPCCQI